MKRIFGILLVLVFIALAVVLGVVMRERPSEEVSKNEAGQQAARQTEQASLKKTLSEIAATDKDFDGVSDVREKELGINSGSADTDGDGILDRDEIELYKTDPKKADTDGDGVNDGAEVLLGRKPTVPDKK